jgi:hypothetical protein
LSSLLDEPQDYAKPIGGRVPVTLLVDEIRQFNQEIRSGQYFYADILREGVLLHDWYVR